jgi:hypothetical protein
MSNHTAQDLLEAVGVDWKHTPNLREPLVNGRANYTGPALNTPELDALLLVVGQIWCVENWHKYDDVNDAIYDSNLQAINETDTFVLEWLLFYCPTPGHALAAAIKEVAG